MAIREVDLGKVRGDINDSQATFTQSETRTNILSGEKGSVIFGKIKKWFADLGAAAFCSVANNATTTAANTVLDGRMGKTLQNGIDILNSNLEKLGGLKFDHQFIPSVTDAYDAANVLTFAGAQLYPGNFTNCAFLAILNSTVTTGSQSVYLIIMGASDAAPVLIKLDSGTETLRPRLTKTSSDRIYPVWTASATIGIHTSLLKLY